MAPILLKKPEAEENGDGKSKPHAQVKTKTTVSTRTTASASSKVARPNVAEKKDAVVDNNKAEGVKQRTASAARQSVAVPAKPSSATSSRASSTNRQSSATTKKEPVKAKSTPTETPEAAAPAKPAAKVLPPPSQILNKHKQADMWSGNKKHKSNFGSAYDSGSIPCRINHGSIKNALQWTKDPATLDFNPLLVTCVEGFLETEHPFVFLARAMFRDLMILDDARDKTVPLLPQLIPSLRIALMSKDEDVFRMALEGTRMISDAVEDEMNTYLPKLTQQIHRQLLTKAMRQQVEETLSTLERNGGKEALLIIRAKIPTYVSVL